ncbi:hypothetical protein PHYBLDRAFT_140976 [Phycomyces blakesleeanus NRRL 1555(-)]|uniref:Uncharacterized protein n=1 Tax=Phycomyces blakesleeanus (strain ATCC 8743b / DSM 1359 / FGSC 10004 / NBRC 33097 / NRRL 1555) TaxID=763407 RepID=A0A167Q1X2_PHYB8|nr:hypothetical protein PHYBLDRAFT_140976 [Phycomyces blakesleeanus NRRL 1555(-)]OAD78919.1 hypothetical protein PHYBLDRAFT_140976 [Phycomyces blakesleeanus NRRL 1555(-)]|eukprot:XP_018296959.1 hypothetical protein PHYBLDRAFT_140976 [Phycomyces blakesleeanus NRRL 1555(-)]
MSSRSLFPQGEHHSPCYHCCKKKSSKKLPLNAAIECTVDAVVMSTQTEVNNTRVTLAKQISLLSVPICDLVNSHTSTLILPVFSKHVQSLNNPELSRKDKTPQTKIGKIVFTCSKTATSLLTDHTQDLICVLCKTSSGVALSPLLSLELIPILNDDRAVFAKVICVPSSFDPFYVIFLYVPSSPASRHAFYSGLQSIATLNYTATPYFMSSSITSNGV